MKGCKSVCIIHNSIKTVVVFRLSYIKKLIFKGYKVYCIAPNDDEQSTKILRDNSVTVITIKCKSLLYKWLFVNFYLLKLIFEKKFKILVVCHFIITFILSMPSIFFVRKSTCFIEGIGTFFTKNKSLLKILKVLLAVGVKNRVFMNQYEKNLLGKKKDVVLGGIGVDLEHFKCSSSDKIKNKFRLISLLYVGRLVEDKGILSIIELIRCLKNKNIKFELNIVGDIYPSNPSSITTQDIDKLKLEFKNEIRFHGYMNDVKHIYAKTDVLLLLSKHEGFPVVVMEANACRVPAICYSVPGCLEVIKEGVNGFLFEEGQIEEVAEFIATHDFTLLEETCKNYAEENFNQVSKNKIIIKIIEGAI